MEVDAQISLLSLLWPMLRIMWPMFRIMWCQSWIYAYKNNCCGRVAACISIRTPYQIIHYGPNYIYLHQNYPEWTKLYI
jgi:hypothetical protein